MSTPILLIEADPSGVVLTIGEDQFGRPETEGIDMGDLVEAAEWMAIKRTDRVRFNGTGGVFTESDVIEMRAAVYSAQARAEGAR